MNNNLYTKFLYIYQIYEYNIWRFAKHTFKFHIFENIKWKDKLSFTKKIVAIFFLTILFQLISVLIIFLTTKDFLISIILYLLIYLLTPFYILLSIIVFYPFEKVVRMYVIKKAKKKVLSISNLKVISVTGCYGKTSTISYLKTLLTSEYKVFAPMLGYNTILGISNEINSKMQLDTEILLIEAGDYKLGEIAEICRNFTPDISVITSIGTQHLERFKTMENLINAKIEIIDNSKKDATIVLPKEVYEMKEIPKYNDKKYIVVDIDLTGFNDLKTYFRIKNISDIVELHTSLIGRHIIKDLALAVTIADILNVKSLQAKINLITPVNRRMNPRILNGVLYIDDTYNIGFESAKAAVEFLDFLKQNTEYKRSIVCTGGIVEQGEKSREVNMKYGQLLNDFVDNIIIFDTPFRHDLEDGIKDKKKITYINGYNELESKCSELLKEGTCVLMQNEITDQYYIK